MPAGLLEDRPADAQDGAVVLGQPNEVGRGQDPVLGMIPTDQGLRADDLLVCECDHGLEVDLDLRAVHRMVERGLEVEPSRRAAARPIRVEQRDPTAPSVFFGAVHGHVRVVQKVVARAARLAHGHADTHRGKDLVATAEHDRLTQHLQHPVGHLARVLW